ncbi:MAG: carboxypeptidase-like regulatory domain-containing protein, partial [Acidobacteriota bacterium]
ELDLAAGFTLTGSIQRAGRPVGGLTVNAVHSNAFVFSEARSDIDGRFSLEGLEGGGYKVHVDDPAGRTLWRGEVEVQSDDDLQIELGGAAVSGRIVDTAGQALSGVSVQLFVLDDAETHSSAPRWRTIVSDDLGRFELGEVAEGRYRLLATKTGFARGELMLTVDGAPLTDLQVILEGGAGVTFRPLRADGVTPAGVRYAVLDAAGQLVSGGDAPVDGGAVRIDSLAAGPHRLLVAEAGGPTVELAVESPGDAGSVALPRGGTLRVEMPELFLDGGGAEIEIRRADGDVYRSVDRALGRTGWLRGSEYIDQVPAGGYTVHVKAGDGRTWQLPAAVVDGGVTELRVP